MEVILREQRCAAVADEPFDVIITGGGISGAAIFAQLARSGYRVLLIDKGDFGSLTSQESAMMIWGGLLYLTRLDLLTVYDLSRNRDELLKHYPQAVHPQYYRYLPLKSGWQMRPLVKGLLDFYRALGGLRRRPNIIEKSFAEQHLVAMSRYRGSVAYEEAMLTSSDTRFVLDLIRAHDSLSSLPLNYVSLEEGEYDSSRHLWQLALREQFTSQQITAKARLVINATGPHADELNRQFEIHSPFKHIFSKGVFLSFARPDGHTTPLIFELGQHRDVLSFIPWGPVSYWGPTETVLHDLAQANEPSESDIDFLMQQANRSLKQPLTRAEIVAYRSGVRPLAVERSYHADHYPLELSRHHRVHVKRDHPWITIYGGKFTSAQGMATHVEEQVANLLGRPERKLRQAIPVSSTPHDTLFPGIAEKLPAIEHCVAHEYCMTISDYLRRRTNIAQWVVRNGLGNRQENLPHIQHLAEQLPKHSATHPQHSLAHYISETQRVFDRLQGNAAGSTA